MKFSDGKNRTCLYLLGGIAGLEGSVLNIITLQQKMINCFLSFVVMMIVCLAKN